MYLLTEESQKNIAAKRTVPSGAVTIMDAILFSRLLPLVRFFLVATSGTATKKVNWDQETNIFIVYLYYSFTFSPYKSPKCAAIWEWRHSIELRVRYWPKCGNKKEDFFGAMRWVRSIVETNGTPSFTLGAWFFTRCDTFGLASIVFSC